MTKTIKEMEKNYGIVFKDVKNKNMKLSTWLRRHKLPSMARALGLLENKKNNH